MRIFRCYFEWIQSWDDDIRYQALYTVEDVIINEDDNKWLKK